MLPNSADRSFERSNQLQEALHHLVPGGAHAYARGSDQYPEFMAPVMTHGVGCRVWDADGNEYIEYGMGLRAVTLGHGFPPVVEAVSAAIAKGVNFTRPTALELAAAEDFLDLVPGADMVKFAKNGSDVTTAALRLARAVTGRVKVAACQQPFFSTDDWFIGSTPMVGGIPQSSREATVLFGYNDLESLAAVLAADDVACVILEAATATAEPQPGFLEGVRQLCDRHASRCQPWQVSASTWSSEACALTVSGCSCCPRHTVPRPAPSQRFVQWSGRTRTTSR
jgi:glutamate-1-semialdehyde 2,1-aminomutase